MGNFFKWFFVVAVQICAALALYLAIDGEA